MKPSHWLATVFKKIRPFLILVHHILHFVITKIYRVFSFNAPSSSKGGIYIYPHNHGRSIQIRLPFRFLSAVLILSLIIVGSSFFLTMGNIVTGVSHYRTVSDNSSKKKLLAEYQDLIKDYLVKHSQKEHLVENTVAVLFGPRTSNNSRGVGGSRQNVSRQELPKGMNQLGADPENWDEFFSKISNEEFLTFVDKHLGNLEDIFTIVDNFETRLDQHKKISKSIPTSWPVRSLELIKKNKTEENLSMESKQEIQESLGKNSLGLSLEEGSLAIESALSLVNDEDSSPQSLIIDINQPMVVVASSRGIVDQVLSKGDEWGVVIQHEFGFSSYYLGMENVNVKEGDLVNRLSPIGTIGAEITEKNPVRPKLKYQIKIANQFANPRDFLIFNY